MGQVWIKRDPLTFKLFGSESILEPFKYKSPPTSRLSGSDNIDLIWSKYKLPLTFKSSGVIDSGSYISLYIRG